MKSDGPAGAVLTRRDWVAEDTLIRFRATLDTPARGDTVPQGFHWCLCLPDDPTGSLSSDGHPDKGGFLPPVPLPRRMWAGSDIEFLAPITVSADIERRSQVRKVTEKTGASGALVFVEVEHSTWANGVEAVRERQNIVYREAAVTSIEMPDASGSPDLSGWSWRRSIEPSPVLLFRYSALTFNSHRIHYDPVYAMAEERYPGLVVHGPLMATLLLDLCARAHGPDALSRFSFQAKSPAFAGQPLHFVGRQDEGGLILQAIGADGRVVMLATAALRE